jgi:hypothetical protein
MSIVPGLVRAANMIAVPSAWCLSLDGTKNWTKDRYCVGAVFFLITGLTVAQEAYEYFKEQVEKSQDKERAQNKRNFKILLISLGIGTTCFLLNTARINQLFEKFTHPYITAMIRGIGFGFASWNMLWMGDFIFPERAKN